MMNFNNTILIINDNQKEELLSKFNTLINTKIITLSELLKKYYFDYNEETIYYVTKKYNVIYEIAKIYIENLYYINENTSSKKIDFLNELKNDLDNNNLLTYNPLFKEFINNKKIIIYNIKYIDKFYTNIFDELSKVSNLEYYNEEENNITKKDLYSFKTKNEEINFVASSICKLIKQGININDIKLCNVSSDYKYEIINTFKQYNIPVNLDNEESIIGTNIVSKFISNYSSNISDTLNSIKDLILTAKDNKIYKKIIDIVNKYYFINDYNDVKDFIITDLSNVKINSNLLSNKIESIDIDNIKNEYYVFLLNYNEGIIPKRNKDEKYLSDKERKLLNISTSYELNELESLKIKDIIKHSNNLIVTYSKYNSKGEIYISSTYEKDMFNEKEYVDEYDDSINHNKIELLKLKDDNYKYGTNSNELNLLSYNYKDFGYMNYDNSFSGLDQMDLKEYLNDKLTLSYTSINSFYQCKYRYYLSNILKLNKYEQTFETIIGNIFHKILSECFVDNYDFDSSWNREVEYYNQKFEYSISDKFFLNILKEELILIIDTIKTQLSYTQLKQSMYEKEIIIDANEDLHITFKGFVDKILYDEFDGETICAIVDYKTGNPNVNINNVVYGLDMQLPVYIYLVKNSNIIKNVRIGGFYLQKIVNNEHNIEKKKELYKLQGYTNSDIGVIRKIDSTYNSSDMIKSMRTSSNGFYKGAKLINDEEIETLSNIVKQKIEVASNDIINSSFDINPKEIDGKNIGCEYCTYKDICYMNNDNIVKLEKPENIFGGEEDGMDE